MHKCERRMLTINFNSGLVPNRALIGGIWVFFEVLNDNGALIKC